MHRLFHDFNNLKPSKREGFVSAPLVCSGTKDDLEALGITLNDGMEVLLYEPDPDPHGNLGFLEVPARVRYDAVRWTPKTGPQVKMDFRRSAGEEKADYESKTQTA